MSENNYGAFMMKSAVAVSDDINAITQPGIYFIPPANSSSPDNQGGVLTVHSGNPIRRTFTSDSVIALVSTRNGNTWSAWSGPLSRTNPFGDIKADGATAIAKALENLGAVAGSGGNYPGDLKFKSVGTNPTEQNGITLVTPSTTAPNALANWMQNDWYDDKVLWGIIRGGTDKATGAGIEVMGLLFSFLADGTMKSGNETVAFQNWVTSKFPLKTALGTAAEKNVGTGTNQIPDMNSFQSGSNANGIWFRLPSGILIQFGMLSATNPTSYSAITFPTPFTETPAYTLSVTSATPVMVVAVGASITGITGVQTFNQAGNQLNNGVPWIAIGRK